VDKKKNLRSLLGICFLFKSLHKDLRIKSPKKLGHTVRNFSVSGDTKYATTGLALRVNNYVCITKNNEAAVRMVRPSTPTPPSQGLTAPYDDPLRDARPPPGSRLLLKVGESPGEEEGGSPPSPPEESGLTALLGLGRRPENNLKSIIYFLGSSGTPRGRYPYL